MRATVQTSRLPWVALGILAGATTACAPALHPVDAKLIACAQPNEASPRNDDIDWEARLETGRHIYAARCKGCHVLLPPEQFAPEAWPEQLAKMAPEATPPLSEAEQAAVLDYLQAVSRCAAPPASAPPAP